MQGVVTLSERFRELEGEIGIAGGRVIGSFREKSLAGSGTGLPIV